MARNYLMYPGGWPWLPSRPACLLSTIDTGGVCGNIWGNLASAAEAKHVLITPLLGTRQGMGDTKYRVVQTWAR